MCQTPLASPRGAGTQAGEGAPPPSARGSAWEITQEAGRPPHHQLPASARRLGPGTIPAGDTGALECCPHFLSTSLARRTCCSLARGPCPPQARGQQLCLSLCPSSLPGPGDARETEFHRQARNFSKSPLQSFIHLAIHSFIPGHTEEQNSCDSGPPAAVARWGRRRVKHTVTGAVTRARAAVGGSGDSLPDGVPSKRTAKA